MVVLCTQIPNLIKRELTYLDVALPASLPKLLTYRFSADEEPPMVGMRVVVPLGNKRLTGIIWNVHQNKPQGYTPRDIEAVVDNRPIVTLAQIQTWSWIARYYMCPLGDVVSSALPSGLKLASKTRIMINPDGGSTEGVSEKGLDLLDALKMREGMNLKEISEVLAIKYPQRIINMLIDRGLAISEEELKEKYKAAKRSFVRIDGEVLEDSEIFNAELAALERRAPAQARALLKYIELSPKGEEVDKVELQKAADVSSAIIKSLVEKKILIAEERVVDRVKGYAGEMKGMPELSEAQAAAHEGVREAMMKRKPVLLNGVTGAGKTEIYVRLIDEALRAGKQVLFLVPEIALTTQLISRLQKFFGDKVLVYHSKFSVSERTETWLKVLEGTPALIVGARSAVFLPFKNLGLSIVDEEHEPSYKQQDPAPRYHARDVVMWLAAKFDIPTVLGSATPSVETVWASQKGNIERVDLLERYGGAMLPEIFVADLKKEQKQRSMRGGFSKLLRDNIEETIKGGRQVILFQNRRGYAPSWQCDACGDASMCERCDIPLTVHKHLGGLHCHHCGYHVSPTPVKCNACGSSSLAAKGLGTQRIEEELAELFPSARVARMDLDTTRSKNAHSKMLTDFSNKEYDILVGTQMVSKGLDFEAVGLVGVMSADRMLTFPDFRSFERAYQMLTQVAGRSGRSTDRGKVVVQTYSPDHWVIRRVVEHNHVKLIEHELIERKNFNYPPYVRLIRITLKHSDESRVKSGAVVLAKRLRQRFSTRVVGPDTPSLARVNDLFHQELLLKFERDVNAFSYRETIVNDLEEFASDPRFKRLRIKVDVDPV